MIWPSLLPFPTLEREKSKATAVLTRWCLLIGTKSNRFYQVCYNIHLQLAIVESPLCNPHAIVWHAYYSESVWCNHMDSPSQYFRFLFYHVSRHCSCQYPTTPSSWNKTILQTHKSHMYHGHNSCFLQFHHFAPELSRQLEPFWPLAVSTPNFYSL